jgi:hypothetical protein
MPRESIRKKLAADTGGRISCYRHRRLHSQAASGEAGVGLRGGRFDGHRHRRLHSQTASGVAAGSAAPARGPLRVADEEARPQREAAAPLPPRAPPPPPNWESPRRGSRRPRRPSGLEPQVPGSFRAGRGGRHGALFEPARGQLVDRTRVVSRAWAMRRTRRRRTRRRRGGGAVPPSAVVRRGPHWGSPTRKPVPSPEPDPTKTPSPEPVPFDTATSAPDPSPCPAVRSCRGEGGRKERGGGG